MNETYPQYIDFSVEEKVLSLWKSGELVGIPTETVYGLSADAESDLAVAKIYSMKSRPQFNPLIIHVANIEVAKKYAHWNPLAEKLAQKFWPGPLTIVLPTAEPTVLSTLALAGGKTVALRAPSHPTFHVLLEKWGRGIAAPSANKSGRVSPTTAQHVRDEFGETLYVVDGGACDVGIESTVVDVTDETGVAILRKGIITQEQLEAVVPIIAAKDEVIKSPGMLLHHYAPSIPVRLNATRVEGDEALLAFGANVPSGARTTLNLSPSGNLIEAAANLFTYLRQLDDAKHKAIAVVEIPNEGVGEAVNDRLRRAS
ncbi:MAG: L-threonylcarbamoyladenylate synthase [Rickettsiales bacterium]